MNAAEHSDFREIAAAIYKLGVVAAELGLTGEESADTLKAAVRRLKDAAFQNDAPNSRHMAWTSWEKDSAAAAMAERCALDELMKRYPTAIACSRLRWDSPEGSHGRVTVNLPAT